MFSPLKYLRHLVLHVFLPNVFGINTDVNKYENVMSYVDTFWKSCVNKWLQRVW